MSCEDQALATTKVCVHFKCHYWIGRTKVKPKLVMDQKGYWRCPSCKTSYGKDAIK